MTFSLPSSSCLRKLPGREFKKLRRQLRGNVKIENWIKIEVSCDYSMLITLYKIGGVHFRLLGTNGFHVKAKNERFTAASSRCLQNLKYENFMSSFGRLRHNIAAKSVPHVQHDYFSSFNQSNHWFVVFSLTLPSSNLKLPINKDRQCLSKYWINNIHIPFTVWSALLFLIGFLQLAITWYKIRHAGGQAHYYSRTGTLKQRDLNQWSLNCLCFDVPVRE